MWCEDENVNPGREPRAAGGFGVESGAATVATERLKEPDLLGTSLSETSPISGFFSCVKQ